MQVALDQAGVAPNKTRTYRTAYVEAAVRDAYGATPLLSCTRGQLVEEVRMCLDLQLKPIDCPPAVRAGGCPPTIILPAGGPVPSSCRAFFPPTLQTAASGAAGGRATALSTTSSS